MIAGDVYNLKKGDNIVKDDAIWLIVICTTIGLFLTKAYIVCYVVH